MIKGSHEGLKPLVPYIFVTLAGMRETEKQRVKDHLIETSALATLPKKVAMTTLDVTKKNCSSKHIHNSGKKKTPSYKDSPDAA